jgi:hypothetical protein
MSVIFGLVLEVILAAAFHELPGSVISRWGPVVSSAIVAMGVAGEVYFGRKSRTDSEELTRRSDERLSEAIAAAAKANERTAVLEKEAADARERTAEIERVFAWRRLTWKEKYKIIDAIRGKIPNDIIVQHGDDPESFMYARQIVELFIEAEVRNVRRESIDIRVDEHPLFGLFVFSDPEMHAVVVRDAFREAGIPIRRDPPMAPSFLGSVPSNIRSGRLLLYVGHKLPPSL